MRLNITLPDYLLKDTDSRAKEMGISRSGYIAAALQFKAQYDDMQKYIPQMMAVYQQHLETLTSEKGHEQQLTPQG